MVAIQRSFIQTSKSYKSLGVQSERSNLPGTAIESCSESAQKDPGFHFLYSTTRLEVLYITTCALKLSFWADEAPNQQIWWDAFVAINAD